METMRAKCLDMKLAREPGSHRFTPLLITAVSYRFTPFHSFSSSYLYKQQNANSCFVVALANKTAINRNCAMLLHAIIQKILPRFIIKNSRVVAALKAVEYRHSKILPKSIITSTQYYTLVLNLE